MDSFGGICMYEELVEFCNIVCIVKNNDVGVFGICVVQVGVLMIKIDWELLGDYFEVKDYEKVKFYRDFC